MRYLTIFVCLLTLPSVSLAQDSLWTKVYDQGGADCGWEVLEMKDSGLFIAGYSQVAGSRAVWILRTDRDGDTIWTKVLGGSEDDMVYSAIRSSDGDFVIAGTTSSFGIANAGYLVKTDSSGNVIWEKSYRSGPILSVKETADGNYICLGTSTHIVLMKVNSSGDSLWAQYCGDGDGQGNDILLTEDGGYILTGYGFPSPSGKACLIKTDSLGNTIWKQEYLGNSDPRAVIQTTDGGYIIAGYYGGSGPAFLIKTDSLGNMQWLTSPVDGGGLYIEQTFDHGYLIGGFIASDGVSLGAALFKTDSSGQAVWARSFGGNAGYSWCKTFDGSYVGTGLSADGNDLFLVKVGMPFVDNVGFEAESSLGNVINHIPRISWHAYVPYSHTPDSFRIEISTDTDWMQAEMWNPGTFPGPDTSITYAGLPLVDGATYYLRLQVYHDLAWSEWHNTSFRMNSVPTMPVHKSPVQDAIVVTTTPALWLFNSNDAESDPLSYDFEVYDGSENLVASTTGIVQKADSTGWTVDVPLSEDQTYHWRARAFDGYEYSAWTMATSFYVNASEEFPSAFLVYFPPDTDNGQVYDKPVEFIWGTAVDPDPSDSVRYKLLIAVDPAFTFMATHDSIYQTRYPVGDLDYSTHYWWKVEAIDTRGNMTPSTNTADFWTWILGDANGDRKVTAGDAVFLVSYIFRGGPPPIRPKAGDANGDCRITVGDAVYLISYIFREGPAPKVGCAK